MEISKRSVCLISIKSGKPVAELPAQALFYRLASRSFKNMKRRHWVLLPIRALRVAAKASVRRAVVLWLRKDGLHSLSSLLLPDALRPRHLHRLGVRALLSGAPLRQVQPPVRALLSGAPPPLRRLVFDRGNSHHLSKRLLLLQPRLLLLRLAR